MAGTVSNILTPMFGMRRTQSTRQLNGAGSPLKPLVAGRDINDKAAAIKRVWEAVDAATREYGYSICDGSNGTILHPGTGKVLYYN